MERLDADRLPHKRDGIPSALLFDRLNALVAEMHAHGWAHGDLRRKNILMDTDDTPYLIDFATAWHAGSRAGLTRRWLFRHWVRVDRANIARIKESYLPDALTADERDILAHQPWHLRAGRWARKRLYRPLKRRNRRKAWRRLLRALHLSK